MNLQQEILDFWFLPPDHPGHGQAREEWFVKNDDFDAEIRRRFLTAFEAAVAGKYLSWTETKDGCLALILLFDQFSRNMFRGQARAFSADGKAREIARHAIARGFYDDMNEKEKQFTILPFEHSENIDDQDYCIKMFAGLNNPELLDYAEKHRVIIKKFGRFPHRNEALGRESTAEEEAFLKTPNSSF